MKEESLLEITRREFRQLRTLADAAIAQLDDEEFFRATPGSNSVAVIVKHVAGNQLSRWRDFLTTDGEKPDRDRDTEFELGPGDTRGSLTRRWEAGWECLFTALEELADEDGTRVVRIRGEPHTVWQAIHRQLSHYAYHVGQIVYVAKGWRGERWQGRSIAKGESRAFNAAPQAYLDEGSAP
ncbi:MAG: hypothetical protein DHS20C21_16770 [Gemmatimonadota bacterium]|nr:MAG: hypothetical protein DHS20C21_16770 [Gemmatimonadota bacterium]